MNFAKLTLSPYNSYSYTDASDIKMMLLGLFLSSDVGCTTDTTASSPTYAEWAFQDRWGTELCGNAIQVEKEHDCIFLSDVFPDEEYNNVKLQMSRQQFIQLLNEWQEKVCRQMPNEVTITYDGHQFFIQTRN